MNVIRTENCKVRPPSRGRGRGKGRDQRLLHKFNVEEPIIKNLHFPKYQSSLSEFRQPLIKGIPTSSSTRTPSNARRFPRLNSSSSARYRSSVSSNIRQTTSNSDGTADSTVIMAITSGRGDARCEVGMAAIDVKFPHMIISQISDTQTFVNTLTKIHFFNPVEIIMPETMCGENDPRKKLFNTIKSKFGEILITPIVRIHFNEENGLERIKTHCADEFSTIELFVKEKYYALAATAALLKYVEHIQHMIYEPKSMKIEFQASQGATLIDVESAMSLELVSSQGPHKNHSLLSSLDRCVTPMGRRLLRSSILQPPCDEDIIKRRLTCVSELVRNRNLLSTLQPITKQLFGADRLLGLSMRTTFVSECVEAAERSLNYILLLKTCLEIIPQLASVLDTALSPNLVKIRENLKNSRFQKMKNQILEIVQADARSVNGYTSANMQRCFALKSGLNDMLDVARQTYCELIEQTTVLVESLANEHHLPLSVACNAALGYYIEMELPKRSNFKIEDLPSVFIEVQKKRNSLYMTTELLIALSQQCKDARDELHIMSNCILDTLICSLRSQVGCLFQLSDDIAELDLLMSLARISAIPDYVKPTFGPNLQIINSKHPILDILAIELPRTNDVESSIQYNFHNITGPNMSGKTTFLKQIVLLQIMAQIGCYLPATEAKIRIVDRIFCRLCPSHEDIESNSSSFIQEMKEIEYILQFVTPQSLIVLDEICRSTNAEEGTAIAFAICKELIQTTAFIFNCTHFIYLTKLVELYPNVVNHYLECVPNELDKYGLKYTHKLRKGVTCIENYGICAASAARMPKSVIVKAKKLVEEIAKDNKPPPLVRAPQLSWQKDCYATLSKILDLIISNEFTIENVQLALEPLRGNKNLEFIQERKDPPSNILQTNFQSNQPDNKIDVSQKIINYIQTQTTSNNVQISAGPSDIIHTSVSNYAGKNIAFENSQRHHHQRSNSESFNEQQMSAETSNHFSDVSNINQKNLMGSHPYQFQDQINYQLDHQSQQQSQNQFQQYYLQRQDQSEKNSQHLSQQQYHQHPQYQQNSPFRIPIAIQPSTSYHIDMNKIKRIESRSPARNSDISNYAFSKKNVLKLRPTNKSLSGLQNTTLQEFGFTREKCYSKKLSSDSQSEQLSDLQNENKSLSFSINSKSKTSNMTSFMQESTNNESSNSTSFKKNLQTDDDKYTKETNSQNLNFSNHSSSAFSLQSEIESRSSSLKRNVELDKDNKFEKPQSQNRSHLNFSVSTNSIQKEIKSPSTASKRSKLDFISEKNEASVNDSVQDSLSSFNTANLSFSFGFNKSSLQSQLLKTSEISSHNKEKSENSCKSQDKPATQKMLNFSQSFGFIKSYFQNSVSSKVSLNNNEESHSLCPSQEQSISKKFSHSSLKKEETKDSLQKKDKSFNLDFESIIDENTLEADKISEFPSPKQATIDIEVLTISTVDTIEAANSVRKKEDLIFNQIGDNANDDEMFIQHMFNSPLSMEFSAELCSCSNTSTLKD